MNYKEIASNVFDIEINGLKEVQSNLSDQFNEIIEAIISASGRCVITGMGKSGLVGKKISATMASTGTKSFFMHPGEAYHGDLGMIHSGDVIIAISNSGETEEIIKLLSFFKDNGNTVIAMTGKKDSTLAKHSKYFLDIGISKEACPLELAPTTSTTVSMALGDAIAMALMEARDFKIENFARFHPGGRLGRKLLTKVSDVMKTEELPVISTDTAFDDVISIISNGRLGIGVLVDNKKIIGVITDGDIRRILKSQKEKALKLTAIEFYSKNPILIDADIKIATAEDIMHEKKITAIIVAENGELRGIINRYDI
jgi:arabinose-5-phosphate isomerase